MRVCRSDTSAPAARENAPGRGPRGTEPLMDTTDSTRPDRSAPTVMADPAASSMRPLRRSAADEHVNAIEALLAAEADRASRFALLLATRALERHDPVKVQGVIRWAAGRGPVRGRRAGGPGEHGRAAVRITCCYSTSRTETTVLRGLDGDQRRLIISAATSAIGAAAARSAAWRSRPSLGLGAARRELARPSPLPAARIPPERRLSLPLQRRQVLLGGARVVPGAAEGKEWHPLGCGHDAASPGS
jgi:hypothetical protein